MELGQIFFKDAVDTEKETALYGVVSLDALEEFSFRLLPYTTATITKLTWSPEAEIQYIDHVRTVLNHQPEQERLLNMAGSVFPGFNVCSVRAGLYFRQRQTPGRRSFSIPCPLHAIHEQRNILDIVGQALETPFNTVIGASNYTFCSGRIFLLVSNP